MRDVVVAQFAEGRAEGICACSSQTETEDLHFSIALSNIFFERKDKFEYPYRNV